MCTCSSSKNTSWIRLSCKILFIHYSHKLNYNKSTSTSLSLSGNLVFGGLVVFLCWTRGTWVHSQLAPSWRVRLVKSFVTTWHLLRLFQCLNWINLHEINTFKMTWRVKHFMDLLAKQRHSKHRFCYKYSFYNTT